MPFRTDLNPRQYPNVHKQNFQNAQFESSQHQNCHGVSPYYQGSEHSLTKKKRTPQQRQKDVITLLLGELKEHNHEKMITMFTELREQLKQKQQQCILLQDEVGELTEQLQSTKILYGKCLKEKDSQKEQSEALAKQKLRLERLVKNLQQEIDEERNKAEESDFYKSKFFQSKGTIKEYDRKLNEVSADEQAYNYKLKDLQLSYEMKLEECEEAIKCSEADNWKLKQTNIKLETQLKRLNLELEEASRCRGQNPKSEQQQDNEQSEQLLFFKSKSECLGRDLYKLQESIEIQRLEFEAALQLEQFKIATFEEHIRSLEVRNQNFQTQIQKMKEETLTDLQQFECLQKKWIESEILIKQVISKLKSVNPENVELVAQYGELLEDKAERIRSGKQVKFLDRETMDFICFSQRENSPSYGSTPLSEVTNSIFQRSVQTLTQEDHSGIKDKTTESDKKYRNANQKGNYRNQRLLDMYDR